MLGGPATPQRTRLEMELDRAVEGVGLDAGARVAEGYRRYGRGHGITAAEHAPATVSVVMVCGGGVVYGGVCGDGVRSELGIGGAAPAGLQPSAFCLLPAAQRLQTITREVYGWGQACMHPDRRPAP